MYERYAYDLLSPDSSTQLLLTTPPALGDPLLLPLFMPSGGGEGSPGEGRCWRCYHLMERVWPLLLPVLLYQGMDLVVPLWGGLLYSCPKGWI